MTIKELIKELTKAFDWDDEVGIEFDGGWTSIKNVSVNENGYKTALIETENEMFDRQYFEECPECKALFTHLENCEKA